MAPQSSQNHHLDLPLTLETQVLESRTPTLLAENILA